MGSVLIGKRQFMDKAMRVRKVLGGGMRQVGYMAAAGLYALDHHVDRMAEDHQRAQEIAILLKDQAYIKSVESTETNIIIFNLKDTIDVASFTNYLFENQIAISDMGQGKLRIVTHYDYDKTAHARVLDVLARF